MERYYTTAGRHDPIRIDIPKGTYVPKFSEQPPNHRPITGKPAEPVSFMKTWPTVLVRPLANLTDEPEDNNLAIGLTAELAHALSHFREILVLEALHRDSASALPLTDSDFIIEGSVRRDSAGVKVTIRLCDAKKCIQIWSGKYQGDL